MSPPAVAAEWRRCREWLLPAIVDSTEREVLADLVAGRAQLWAGDAGAFVTQLYDGPEPFILVWLAGGDLRCLLGMQPGLEAWARSQGARAARINGRRGWARVLKQTGFHPDGDELRKAL